jgi:hypothetical protein
VVTLTANPGTGYHFVSWSGGLGTVSPVAVTMDADKTVTATFAVNPGVPPTTLTATQIKSGNGSGFTTKIRLTWPTLESGSTIEVWRTSYGNYPEYNDSPGAGSEPTKPTAYEPPLRWLKLTAIHNSGDLDAPATRDFYYYIAYVTDQYGTRSASSEVTVGALDYFLGDVTDGVPPTPGPGDNLVNGVDVSLLGTHYGAHLGTSDPLSYIDVGPTTTRQPSGLPLTDNMLEFEDLVIFAINYGQVSVPQMSAGPVAAVAAAGKDEIVLERPERVALGANVTATLTLSGTGLLRALSTKLAWDPAVVEPVGHTAGEWLVNQRGVAFSAKPGTVDAAVLGASGLTGEGVLATVAFKVLSAGDPKIRIETLDARDGANQTVTLAQSERALAAVVPTVTRLAFAQPNPFRGEAQIGFSLAQRSAVELAIYSVDGRRVRTLVSGLREPGEYRQAWDGRDDQGSPASAGVYYARLVAGKNHFTRTVVYLK